MKHAVLFLAFVPIFLNAQVADPRISETTPALGIQSVKTTTFIKTVRDGDKLDTAVKQFSYFNKQGLLTESRYATVLDKGTYTSRRQYFYNPECCWRNIYYENDVVRDCTFVCEGCGEDNWGLVKSFGESGRIVLHEYEGDSVRERVITGIDTVNRPWKKLMHTDAFWDYKNAGAFARRQITKSVDSDTVKYLDQNGECLVMIVNHFNNSFQNVQTNYYNYKIKNFVFMKIRYNDKMDMGFFLEKCKKGRWSYQVLRNFDNKGLVVEEKYIDSNKKKPVIIKRFEYEYY